MKKLLLGILTCATALTLAACGDGNKTKFGFIFLHDQKSTYDKNFIDAAKDACKELGVKALLKTNVEEGEGCYNAAKELVNKGCKGVFADSFGHEEFMIRAAKEFTNVEFAHATGTHAHCLDADHSTLTNFHNAFAAIYEGRYTAGIAAGMKLNEMINAGKITADQAVMGYVGAFPYAEVVSGYTSFYLGAKSVCPSVTMKVRYTSSWYDFDAEKAACEALITKDKCVLISQHADSYGAPEACEAAGVPNVTYNGSTVAKCPKTYVVSSKIDWTPYFEYMIKQTVAGQKIATDWTGTIDTGSVKLNKVGSKAPASGTQKKIDEVKAKLLDGSLKVFDCSTFTVGGQHLTEYLADVDDVAPLYTGDTNVIKTENGVTYFDESAFRSAPYFDLRIDGITEINEN